MTVSKSPLRILFVSTSVGPLGSGIGGGVELTLRNLGQELQRRGHNITVVAPAGSVAGDLPVVPISGQLQSLAQSQSREDPILLLPNSVLANMWDYARSVQHEYDVLVNFAYDWLPFYLTAYFSRPIAHLVSMGSLSDAMDQIIGEAVRRFPGSIGMHSRAQAATFDFAEECRILGNGFDLTQYQFCATPQHEVAWVGRVAPEKGLEDAIAAIEKTGTRLKIWGALTDAEYWQHIQQRFPDAPYQYEGFLSTQELQQQLGQCRALLVTPKWIEAFGNVVIEALACGVPVIAYRRGGPAEIVQDGLTGWIVEPDSVRELTRAIAQIDQIDRQTCRQQAEAQYSNQAMGDRVEGWLRDLIGVTE
ncbi:glycosyltransferase family 4 protein [Leptolyngbya sp. AN02str]|uniref:glycosyltransferase family 4 protein n=1 Tax=Leptolyngbya sp. AN02str TaxID=3423363 RepID=UPI003D30FA8E